MALGISSSNSALDNYFAGQVGIGTSTPAYPLHVAGNVGNVLMVEAYADTGNSPGLLSRKARGTMSSPTAVQAGDFLGSILGAGWTSVAWSANVGAVSVRAAETFTPTANGSYITLETTAIGATGRSEKVRVDSAGNVGIGTTSPGYTLDVTGTGRFTGNVVAADPTLSTQLATKNYVDTQVISAGGGLTVVIVSAATQAAVSGNQYVMTYTPTASVITLPASPSVGNTVAVSNFTGRTDLLVARNGSNIMQLAQDMTIDSTSVTVTFKYISATIGWALV